MRYFKWGGVLLLVLCGVLTGLCAAAFERRRYRQAEGFLALLRHIRGQIECFSTPLRGIFAACDASVWAACGMKHPASQAFSEQLESTPLYLPQEACRLLFDFAARLGTGYREEQLRCCDYFLQRLTPICDKMRTELPKRERMALFLPVAAAAILALMLI